MRHTHACRETCCESLPPGGISKPQKQAASLESSASILTYSCSTCDVDSPDFEAKNEHEGFATEEVWSSRLTLKSVAVRNFRVRFFGTFFGTFARDSDVAADCCGVALEARPRSLARPPAMLYSPARLLLLIVALVTVTPACGFAAAPSAACTRLPLAARASFLAVVMQQPKAA